MFTASGHSTPTHKRAASAKQLGFTLIETILAIALGASMMAAAAFALEKRSDEVRDKAAAEHLKIMMSAAENFARDNFLKLREEAPAKYSVSEMESYLPPGFGASPYGETYRVVTRPIIKPVATGGVVENQKVGAEVLVVSGRDTSLNVKGEAPSEAGRIPMVAALAGARVGYFSDKVPEAVRCRSPDGNVYDICGAYGGFAAFYDGVDAQRSFPDHDLTAPTFAGLLYMDYGHVTADYLYRVDVGRPELNTMFTNLRMDGNGTKHDVLGANLVDAVDVQASNNVEAGVDVSAGRDVAAGRDVVATESLRGNRGDITTDLQVGQNAGVGGNLTVMGDASLRDLSARNSIFSGNMRAASGDITTNLMVGQDVRARAFYYSSDARLKENVKGIDAPLDRLLSIRGVEYDWLSGGQHDMGLIAQDVAKAFPHLVSEMPDGTLAVKYANLVGPIVESIRVLKVENDVQRLRLKYMGGSPLSPYEVAWLRHAEAWLSSGHNAR